MKGYPKIMPLLVWGLCSVLVISGLALIPGMLDMKFEMDAPKLLPSGWRMGMAATHALGAFLCIGLVGSLLPLHMRVGLKRRANLSSGFVILGLFFLLVLSALAIYYVGDQEIGNLTSAVHTLLGIVLPILIILHARRRQSAVG